MQKKQFLIVGGVLAVLLIVISIYQGSIRPLMVKTGSYGGVMQQGADAYGIAEMSSDMAVGFAGKAVAPSMARMPSPLPPTTPGYETGGGEEFMPKERLIIKTGNISVVVKDVQASVSKIIEYAVKNGGFEVSRNIYKNGTALNGDVTIRVPSKLFDSGIEEMRKLGEVQGQQVNGQDVTEEFVDVQAQLKNLKATEAQFLEIMARAQKIEDVLAVQRELANVRSNIERLEGRKKYLEQSASLSTITVHLSTDPETLPIVEKEDQWKPIVVVKEAARGLVEVGKTVANAIIWFVVYMPVWVGILLILWLGRKLVRRFQQRSK